MKTKHLFLLLIVVICSFTSFSQPFSKDIPLELAKNETLSCLKSNKNGFMVAIIKINITDSLKKYYLWSIDTNLTITRSDFFDDIPFSNINNFNEIVFVAKINKEEFVVTKNQKLGPYKEVSSLYHSDSCNSLRYIVENEEGEWVFVNGEKQGPFTRIEDMMEFWEFDMFGYWGWKNNKYFCSIEGDNYSKFDDLKVDPKSVRGKEFTMIYTRNKSVYIKNRTQKFGPYDAVSDKIEYAKDGRVLAFVAKKNKKWYCYIDGNKKRLKNVEESFFNYYDDYAFFNQNDTVRFVYEVKLGNSEYFNNYYIIDDTIKVGPFGAVGGLDFTDDGSKLMYYCSYGNKWCAVINHVKYGPFDDIPTFLKVSKGGKIGYTVKNDGEFHVFINDKIYGIFDEIGDSYYNQLFSSSGEHFACFAKQGGFWYLFFDDKRFGPYQNPRKLSFTENDQITYCATENGVDGFYINGKMKSTECPDDLFSIRLSDEKGNFAYTAKRDSSYYLVYNDQKFGPYTWCNIRYFIGNSDVLLFHSYGSGEYGSHKILYNNKIYISSIVYEKDLMLHKRDDCIGIVYYDPDAKMIRYLSANNSVPKP